MHSIFLVTPCMNAATTIVSTIESVIAQRCTCPVYYHVQDACSTDGTQKILEKYSDIIRNNNENIHFSWDSSKDRGMYDAICKGMARWVMLPDDWMGWINADDILWDGGLNKFLAAVSLHDDVHWAGGIPVSVDLDGCPRPARPGFGYPREFLQAGLCDGIHWHYLQQEGIFWKKWVWDEVGGLDTSFSLAADWDLWRRMAHVTPYVQLSFHTAAFHKRRGQLSEGQAYDLELSARLPLKQRQTLFRSLVMRSRLELRYFPLCEGQHQKLCEHKILLPWVIKLKIFLLYNNLYGVFRLLFKVRKLCISLLRKARLIACTTRC